MKRRKVILLASITLFYLITAALFAIYTPAWQAPDEPGHYNHIRQIAEAGCCPILDEDDLDLEYLSQLLQNRFAPELLDRLHTVRYEDYQPPLYYILASGVYRLTEGSLVALRLLSVILGAGIILCAYGVARLTLPQKSWVALGTAAFVAFLPQHLALMAGVSNDPLAELIVGITLLLTIYYLKGAAVPLWLLGVLVGVGFLTKGTAYFLALIVPVAVLLRWHTQERAQGVTVLLHRWMVFLVPALALGMILWVRNIDTYGFPDFLATRRYDQLSNPGGLYDQSRTEDYIRNHGLQDYLRMAAGGIFNSFWGQFGWATLPMSVPMRLLTGVISAFIVLGTGLELFVLRRNTPGGFFSDSTQRNIWIVLWLTIFSAVAGLVYYNSIYVVAFGRFLFPALIPIALLVALALEAWRRFLLQQAVEVRWIVVAAPLLLGLVCLLLLFTYIVPMLAPL